MLDSKGFDLWAKDYNNSVSISDESNEYPFAGYNLVLNKIYNEVQQKNFLDILDIGFGTALLTSQLYRNGLEITGIDFSDQMIEIAAIKMPKAKLICYDFTKGLPTDVLDEKYDCIISTYAIHHISDNKKAEFIKNLCALLRENGEIIIGDISFQKSEELIMCKKKFENIWDNDEVYFVYEELQKFIGENYISNYEKISDCSGVLIIKNK